MKLEYKDPVNLMIERDSLLKERKELLNKVNKIDDEIDKLSNTIRNKTDENAFKKLLDRYGVLFGKGFASPEHEVRLRRASINYIPVEFFISTIHYDNGIQFCDIGNIKKYMEITEQNMARLDELGEQYDATRYINFKKFVESKSEISRNDLLEYFNQTK